MLEKKIKKENSVYRISIFSIWKKSIFGNEFTVLDDEEKYIWKISSTYRFIMFFLRNLKPLIWIVIIFFSSNYIMDRVPWNSHDARTSLFGVALNLLIIIAPVVLFEIILAKITPIDIQENLKDSK